MKLEVEDDDAVLDEQLTNRLALAVVQHLDNSYQLQLQNNPLFNRVKARYQQVADTAGQRLSGAECPNDILKINQEMLLDIISVRRRLLKNLQKLKEYPDELILAKQRELDIEEAGIRKT